MFPVDPKSPWPPREYQRGYDLLAEHAAWYSGNPGDLTRFYRTVNRTETKLLFWSRTRETERHEPASRMHLPAAADIARVSAGLLVGTPPMVRVPSDHAGQAASATQARIDELSSRALILPALKEAMEIAAALGGAYLIPTWDRTIADYPLLDVVHPDSAVPVFRRGRLVDVTFWRTLADDGRVVLRHLERHSPGRIEHRLYRGNPLHIGSPVPLGEHPETALLLGNADATGAEVAEGQTALVTPSLFDELDVLYVPNDRPVRVLRGDPQAGMWGRSDLEQLPPLLDALDLAWYGLVRDIRLGKARVIVPHEYLSRGDRPGDGAYFNIDAEIFSPLDLPPGSTDAPTITPVQFAIRVEEHLRAADAAITKIVDMAGYSPQTFGIGLDGAGAESGTARRIRERKSVTTTAAKERYWQPAIREAWRRLLTIDREVFGHRTLIPVAPEVELGDPFASGTLELAQSVELLHRAESASLETRVRMVHPDWSQAEIAEEAERIRSESSAHVVDLDPLPPADRPGGTAPPADVDGDAQDDDADAQDDAQSDDA